MVNLLTISSLIKLIILTYLQKHLPVIQHKLLSTPSITTLVNIVTVQEMFSRKKSFKNFVYSRLYDTL